MADGSTLSIQRQPDFFIRDQGMPISKGNLTKRPVAEDDKAPASKGIKRKRDESLMQQTQEESPSKKSRTEGELLPNIEAKQVLPEKGSEVDFSSSFLHKKVAAETVKPELPKPEWKRAEVSGTPEQKIAIGAHRQEPLINYSSRMSYKPTELSSQFERNLMGSDNGLMLRIANSVIEMRMEEQLELLESFKHLNDKMRHVHGEKAKLLNDMAENAKLEDYWSSMRSLISYLTAGVGIVMGVGMTAFGAYTANPAAIQSGIMTTIGGFGSVGSQWMSEKKYDDNLVNATALLSSLLVGYNAIPQSFLTAKTAMNVMGAGGQSISQYQISKAKANEFQIQAEANNLQFNHEKTKSKQSKALGGMKLTELMNEVKAASGQIADEDKLKERIAQMLSSAA